MLFLCYHTGLICFLVFVGTGIAAKSISLHDLARYCAHDISVFGSHLLWQVTHPNGAATGIQRTIVPLFLAVLS